MSIYVLLFIIGYIFIVSEQFTKIDKAVPALLTGMLSWMILFAASSDIDVTQQALSEHLSSISEKIKTVQIYSVTGSLSYIQDITSEQQVSVNADLAKAMYFIQVLNETGIIATEKIIIQ